MNPYLLHRRKSFRPTGISVISLASYTALDRPNDIAVSNGGNAVYTTIGNNNVIYRYARNVGTGLLSAPNSTSAGSFPFALRRSGGFIYVASLATSQMLVYSTSAVNDSITSVQTLGTINSPRFVEITADGKFLYCQSTVSNLVRGHSINLATGLLTVVGSDLSTSATVLGMASCFSKFLYIANGATNSIQLFNINTTTGALTAGGTALTLSGTPGSITADYVNNIVYVSEGNPSTVRAYSVDNTTGALTLLGSRLGTYNVSAMTVSNATNSLVTISGGRTSSVFSLSSSIPSSESFYTTTWNSRCVALDPSGVYFYVGTGEGSFPSTSVSVDAFRIQA